MRIFTNVLRTISACLLLGTYALAGVNGTISGIVKDPSGAVVANAEVRVTNLETNVETTTLTDSLGEYHFLSLPVGTYRLEAAAPGFGHYQQLDIRLNTDDALRFDLALKLGQTIDTVDVQADAVHVETANTQLGDVISGTHMADMPLNGRNFTDLLGLQAGVVPQISPAASGYGNFFGSTQQGNVSISGQRETSNGFLINGASVNNAENNGSTIVPNLDSIAEFRVLTSNFDPEYGNYSGGIITVVTVGLE
jgi:hypothetical protein